MRMSILNTATTEQMGYGIISFFVYTKSTNSYFIIGVCNPWPILEEDKTETDSEIKISYDFLKESSDIFENWKAN